MFSRQRKARVLFGLSDIFLATLAFEAAYQTRALLHLEHEFYLLVERKALVLGVSPWSPGSRSDSGSKSTKNSIPAIRGSSCAIRPASAPMARSA